MRVPALLTLVLLAAACRTDKQEETGEPSCIWYHDADGDGFGNVDEPQEGDCDATNPSYVRDATDCDDTDAGRNPRALEICDELDNNCNGEVDEDTDAAPAWYLDTDGDGYGDPATELHSCLEPDGYGSNGTDCDDDDPSTFPGATERCDGADNDCDGQVDDDLTWLWYADADGDGWGDPAVTVESCDPGEGWTEDGEDCDDAAAGINPDAEEVCDGLDQDCDGEVDEGLLGTWYRDADGDAFGDAATGREACDPGEGWVQDAGDCDDTNGTVSPDATEACNGWDDDCDGLLDDADPEALAGTTTWYVDTDADGYGDDATATVSCVGAPGTVAMGGDCDDTNPAWNPGAVETDCTDPADYNCDGSTGYADNDGDGYAACEECDDADEDNHPGATETCDGEDNDCDGTVDEPDAEDASTFWADADGDGWGDPATPTTACTAPTGFVADDTDCDDTDPAAHPSGAESCNGADDDCDGSVDEGVLSTFWTDADADGWGDPASPVTACEAPTGTVADASDCLDSSAAVHPGADETCNGLDDDCDGATDEADAVDATTWYRDRDEDGWGDATTSTVACTAPSGYVAGSEVFDCDDRDDEIYPAAGEVCDGDDNDCDGAVDELASDASTWYADQDGDGYGDPSLSAPACTAPSGYVSDDTDCDDRDPAVHPAATEVCDGADQDCDGVVDEGATGLGTWYADDDADGYGDPTTATSGCEAPTGWVTDATDCDDTSGAVHPGAEETCDGEDDDCDGTTDEADATDATTWYRDRDEDGWGDATTSTPACTAPSGYVAAGTSFDCDDRDAATFPGATESCNGADDDCDGTIDEAGATGATTWYADADADGWGDAATATTACTAPSGYVSTSTDCDDTDAAVRPGATETCDGVDQDCDGSVDEGATDLSTWYQDADDDGYGDAAVTTRACGAPSGYTATATDCDDTNASVHPASTEVCNGVDDDCDGTVDEASAADASTWYRDRDEDGWGDSTTSTVSCTAPTGYVAGSGVFDCDDRDAATGPGAAEVCNGKDDNCDGIVDDETAADADTWYTDADGDAYGDPASATRACTRPAGAVTDGTDCDDTSAAVRPGATETCDGVDQDCDGSVDEGATDMSTWYADTDGDGYGLSTSTTRACSAPTGYTATSGDCADTDATAYPGASETCDGVDDDCDGTVDDAATDMTTWCRDRDGDSWGDDATTRTACEAPTGYVADCTDCNDASTAARPGGTEVCDSLDNDCDGSVDEGVESTWYLDYDGDGFGTDASAVEACAAPTSRYVSDSGDCDDTSASTFPDATPGCDGGDWDCDGLVDNDADEDGYADAECGGDDCDDTDADLLPEVGGGCAMGLTCYDILLQGRADGDGTYTIDPDGYATGVDPVDVWCDMTTDGGGWTMIEYAADLAFKQWFTGGDTWRWLSSDFTTVLPKATITLIQSLSTEGNQTYVGLCEHVIHYYYTGGASYAYAFGFEFLDGSTTAYGTASYVPYDVTILQDGCKVNGGEGGLISKSTMFYFDTVEVPITNVYSRDAGDSWGEYFGSPLTDYPAWLR